MSLAEKGYFYICDEQFVTEHGLESDYENLVSIDVIETLLKQDKNTIKSVLNTCKLSQLDTIVDYIAQQVLDGAITIDELEDTGKLGIINKAYKERKENELYDFRNMVSELQEIKNINRK